MKKIFVTLMSIAMIAICASSAQAKQTAKFPKVNQKGKIAVVAHRGFWKCDEAGYSENSLASLIAAQRNGFWGSECDIHLTKDDVIIVNHNNDVDGAAIADHTYAELAEYKLPNGESRPTFEQYLLQAKKCKTTKLIIEFKKQPSQEREALLVEKTMKMLKDNGMYNPKRVLFITFSEFMCEKVAAEHPQFINQFLTSELDDKHAPENYAAKGINGIDYHQKIFKATPGWVTQAHKQGMSVNVWTVNKKKDIKKMIDLGVDAITTNEPLLVRELLGEKELKN